MNHRASLILIFVLLVVLSIFMGFIIIKNHIKAAQTYDVFGAIIVTMDRTLTQKSWDSGYDLVSETSHEFPKTKVRDQQILDRWSNPIMIKIEDSGSAFNFTITSPGKDRRLGTNDDLQKTGSIRKE